VNKTEQTVRREIETLKQKWDDWLREGMPVLDETDDDEIWDLLHDIDELGAEASIWVGRVLKGRKHIWSRSRGRYLERKIQSLLKRKPEYSEALAELSRIYYELKEILVLVDIVGKRKPRASEDSSKIG